MNGPKKKKAKVSSVKGKENAQSGVALEENPESKMIAAAPAPKNSKSKAKPPGAARGKPGPKPKAKSEQEVTKEGGVPAETDKEKRKKPSKPKSKVEKKDGSDSGIDRPPESIIVLSLGSAFLRIGRCTDDAPIAIPTLLAFRTSPGVARAPLFRCQSVVPPEFKALFAPAADARARKLAATERDMRKRKKLRAPVNSFFQEVSSATNGNAAPLDSLEVAPTPVIALPTLITRSSGGPQRPAGDRPQR
jgi:hypothetical protein